MTAQPPQSIQNPQNPQNKTHSAAYYPLLVVAIILGIALTIGILVWITTNATGRVRIPYIVLIFPTLVLVGLVKLIDEALLKRQSRPDPNAPGRGAMPVTNPSGQSGPSSYGGPAGPAESAPAGYGQQMSRSEEATSYGQSQQAQASGYGQAQAPASGYGQAQAPASGYGQAQAQASGYGQAQAQASGYGQAQAPASGYGQAQAPASGYGQAQQPRTPERGSGDSGYGWRPASGYGQTPPMEVRPPYGQDGSRRS